MELAKDKKDEKAISKKIPQIKSTKPNKTITKSRRKISLKIYSKKQITFKDRHSQLYNLLKNFRIKRESLLSSIKIRKKRTTEKISKVEYYDLPNRYNQTVVKVLAQTPTNLFIYWEISDEDRENYKKVYGDNFFETTKPILKIYNDSMNYNFEVEINDFANSWYLHVNDSKCDYRIELGRKVIYNPVQNSEITENLKNTNYIYISSSNEIESPNNRILFNPTEHMVYYKNIHTMQIKSKKVSSLTFMNNIGKMYNINDFYKEMYNIDVEKSHTILTKNPSSGLTMSGLCNF